MVNAREYLKSAPLLLIPVLMTAWFISDGGLHNGLNRLVYEVSVGLFFAVYGLLWACVEGINRRRQQHFPFNFRVTAWSWSLLLSWIILASLYEYSD